MSLNDSQLRYLEALIKAEKLDEELSQCVPFDNVTEHFPDLVKLVVSKNYKEARTALTKIPSELFGDVRAVFNRSVLLAREKEWTSHGVCKTFRFWSPEEKTAYLAFSQKVLMALRERYQASFGYGTVLAIHREQDLIPHDDDLDIIVSVKTDDVSTYNATLQSLQDYLANAGFEVKGDYVAHRHVTDGSFYVDIFLGLQTGDKVSWHPGPREEMLFSTVFPTKTVSMFGIDCPVPNDCETYLAAIYGSDWRIPRPGWSHDFSPTKYSDWFWPAAK